ncbi:hypothetical protein IW148_001888 [Coemansia sp. RSA 1199]|nr:hypothetical protein IW148_001888 [Coemansia sp. RSA 1199]
MAPVTYVQLKETNGLILSQRPVDAAKWTQFVQELNSILAKMPGSLINNVANFCIINMATLGMVSHVRDMYNDHCTTQDVEIIGRTWAANGDWSTFDHRVDTLHSLPRSMMVNELQRSCDGVNVISEHVVWSQTLLAPFYEASGKKGLAKADVDKLCQPWADLLCAPQNVELLFVPPPGAPLVLCTDASNMGLVLLS